MVSLVFNSSYFDNYMRLVEDTESPRLYHIWSALWGISVCLGRRCWVQNGPFRIYPNQYVVLVGNPASRKNSASDLIVRLVQEHTDVRFAPPSTGGHQNGIMRAMVGKEDESINVDKFVQQTGKHSIADLSTEELYTMPMGGRVIAADDRHAVAIAPREFSAFIGQKSRPICDFLTDIWDAPEVHHHQTVSQGKPTAVKLHKPLINMLGATTPTNLMEAMPAGALGQGILSRIILVFGHGKHKSIPVPKKPPSHLADRIGHHLRTIYTEFHKSFQETPQAITKRAELYDDDLVITDARFIYYKERRQAHLVKVAMAFAASCGRTEIRAIDYEHADQLLRQTEKLMPQALGEFGMSKVAAAKQRIVEFIRECEDPVGLGTLRAVMHRDLSMGDLIACMEDLVASDQVVKHKDAKNGVSFLPKLDKRMIQRELMDLMCEPEQDEAGEEGMGAA